MFVAHTRVQNVAVMGEPDLEVAPLFSPAGMDHPRLDQASFTVEARRPIRLTLVAFPMHGRRTDSLSKE